MHACEPSVSTKYSVSVVARDCPNPIHRITSFSASVNREISRLPSKEVVEEVVKDRDTFSGAYYYYYYYYY